jgi:hypothetical protein
MLLCACVLYHTVALSGRFVFSQLRVRICMHVCWLSALQDEATGETLYRAPVGQAEFLYGQTSASSSDAQF